MAELSNKQRVQHGLDLLAEALEPYIEQVTAPHLAPGSKWTAILEARTQSQWAAHDPLAQLKIMGEGWGQGKRNPFFDRLSRAAGGWVQELIETRNKAQHNEPFSADQARRSLETMELLLREIGAPHQADAVRKLANDITRQSIAAEAKRDARAILTMPSLADDLPAWRDVLQPHADIASGDFANAEFAADLAQVAAGTATSDYGDPVEFFARTFPTDGLKTLLKLAVKRVAGDGNADPVINLQTTFGGGKTHSMLAVWHLFSGRSGTAYSQWVQDELKGLPVDVLTNQVKRVAIDGTGLMPGQAWKKADGTEIRTIWGELAYQLGGAEGYTMIAEADRTGTNPGGALKELIAKYAPAVILIDEWVAYARGLWGQEGLVGGSFETQFTFAQALTQAVKDVPGALLLVSIPASDVRRDDGEATASDLEVGGANGRAALERLQNVVDRLAYPWAPASSVESFEIVKRRLFREPDGDALKTIDAVCRRFTKFYTDHAGELPTNSRDYGYEARMVAAYPIHPALFDRLYGDWSTLERFQRTRGVLRLMSAVVHALYNSKDDSPLIMVGSVPLDVPDVRDELARYLDPAWKAIIEKDIDGELSTSVAIDKEKPLFGKRALTRRIARTSFISSVATLGTAHKGAERKEIFLGVAMPGDTVGNFGSALDLLGDRSTYLYNESGRYWFDRQPSLNRVVSEKAESYSQADVWAEIIARLRREPKQTAELADVVVAPETTGDVIESDRVRLVIAHPMYTDDGKGKAGTARDWVEQLIQKCGSAPRLSKNTFVVIAADPERLAELESAVRQYKAWGDIYNSKDALDLTQGQVAEAQRKADQFNKTVEQRIRETWIRGLYPEPDGDGHEVRVAQRKADGATDSIARFAGERLARDSAVQTVTSPASLAIALNGRLKTVWDKGRISVKDLWETHHRYLYMPRLKDKNVLLAAIPTVMTDLAWNTAFALADGYDEATGDFIGLRVPLEDAAPPAIIDTTLLVRPDLATAQREREQAAAAAAAASAEEGSTAPPEAPTGGTKVAEPPKAPAYVPTPNVEFTATVDLKTSGNLPSQMKQLAEEILDLIQRADPDTFDVRIEIEAGKSGGFDTTTVRNVKENAATLGVTKSKFEAK